MPFMVANSYFGMAVEGTYGTAASISTFTPIGSPKLAPALKWLDDSDFRGSPTMHYDQVPGVRNDAYDAKVFMYSDVYPQLVRAVLGSTDSVASVGPSTWTHTIGLLNSASTGSQPPSYTIVNSSVDGTYQMTGSRAVEMSLSFAADAAVETTFSFIGNPASVVAGPTINESTQHLVPAWNCAASIGGASVAVVESAQLDIKRGTAPIFTLGQQSPYNNFAGPIEVAGSLGFVVETGETYWANSLVRDEQQVILQFQDPASAIGAYVQFTMSAVQLEDPVIDQSKNYVTLQTKFTAVANTTDALSGYAPIKSVIKNGVSTTY